jgi:hypothetical protein
LTSSIVAFHESVYLRASPAGMVLELLPSLGCGVPGAMRM